MSPLSRLSRRPPRKGRKARAVFRLRRRALQAVSVRLAEVLPSLHLNFGRVNAAWKADWPLRAKGGKEKLRGIFDFWFDVRRLTFRLSVRVFFDKPTGVQETFFRIGGTPGTVVFAVPWLGVRRTTTKVRVVSFARPDTHANG